MQNYGNIAVKYYTGMSFKINLYLSLVSLFITLILQTQAQNNENKIIYQNKIYRTECAWFTMAAGLGYQASLKDIEKNISVGINFRIKKIREYYFNAGYHFTSNEVIYKRSMQRMTDLHVGIGLRREELKQNIYFFCGPSNSYGYVYDHTDSDGDRYYKGFNTLGFYSEFQFTYKIFYDIGIGTSFYANINKYYKVVGVQLHLYFSMAYRDKIRFDKIKQ